MTATPRERLEAVVDSERLRRSHGDDVTAMADELASQLEAAEEFVAALEEAVQAAETAGEAIDAWADVVDEEGDPEVRAEHREQALGAIGDFLETLYATEPNAGDEEPAAPPEPAHSPAWQARLDQVNEAIMDLGRDANHALTVWYIRQGFPKRFRDLDEDQLHAVARPVRP